jgi:hypothetical protein
MKLTLIKMDYSAFLFVVENEAEVAKIRHGAGDHEHGATVLFYEGPTGKWSNDNANPIRQRANTLKLSEVKKLSFVRAAVDKVEERKAELQREYECDSSMYQARLEIHRYREAEALRELKAAIAANPTDEHGDIAVAAERYGKVAFEAPEPPTNPFAYIARLRADNRKFEEQKNKAK